MKQKEKKMPKKYFELIVIHAETTREKNNINDE